MTLVHIVPDGNADFYLLTKGTQSAKILYMITYNWNKEKNLLLKETRGISFEQIVMHIEKGDLIDIIKHQNKQKYANQKILVIYLFFRLLLHL